MASDDAHDAEKGRVNWLMADLVSRVDCEDALATLLSGEPDRWLAATQLAAQSPGFAEVVERAGPEGSRVWLRWMEHPSGDDGYCLVLVYWPEGIHPEMAIYNRTRLLRRQ